MKEMKRRLEEFRARTMVRVANRTFKKQPNRVDRLAIKLLEKATATSPDRRTS
jgi:hypothetical protein